MNIMKLILLACITLMASCSLQQKSNNKQTGSRTFFIDEKALTNGTLLIHLPEHKPKCLSIKTPDNEWFVVQDNEESVETMPQAQFDSASKLEFNIKTLKGATWRDSRKTIEVIFKSPGHYLIYFADNLETEPENTYTLQEVIEIKSTH
ncbi:MAG: hypothetical protein OQK98_10540 [Gammaproteobacteria bacterium]|nr:hypothetical protein [Gammaproteobacteria bacterium]